KARSNRTKIEQQRSTDPSIPCLIDNMQLINKLAIKNIHIEIKVSVFDYLHFCYRTMQNIFINSYC
ncbi:MAG: hypothetical protein ACPGVL_14350, partial [Pseudoalteromonas spongiae]